MKMFLLEKFYSLNAAIKGARFLRVPGHVVLVATFMALLWCTNLTSLGPLGPNYGQWSSLIIGWA